MLQPLALIRPSSFQLDWGNQNSSDYSLVRIILEKFNLPV